MHKVLNALVSLESFSILVLEERMESNHQSKTFECVGAIAYYGLYPNRTALTLGLGKVTWKIHRFRKIRWPNRSSERNLKANLLN